jgi:serine/threonine-protein kinase
VTTPLFDALQAALGTQYKLERELGRGGMATVYLATDTKHGRQVALKVLHPDLAASLGPERFRREIGFAATLSHPHILTVLDSGQTPDGQLWFTMPYVEGETLREHLRRDKQLPIDEALRITREIASALDYAHEKGVIHRDIKPENLLITKRGDALLADFGIARALGRDGASGATLTQTGLAVGTPQYMSPEQASGDPDLGSRSDIYSLAAVCYEMLAGEPPFSGVNLQAMIAKMMTSDAPSVRVLRPSVPPPVDAILQKALARVPADRWATAGEFSRALETAERSAHTETFAPAAASAHRSGRRRVPATALALILGVLVGGGMLFAWRTKGHDVAGTDASGAIRLAVLPFENLGDTSDAYFADGVTEAVRGKLTGLPGIEVIGSASSAQYRKSAKTTQQIGEELGVRYLLIGHVRWAKGAGGTSRVQVSPELVDVGTAADKWQQPFDAPLTDVFAVQADIATKVAHALQVALTPVAQQSLTARPTADLAAYDAYLRGQDMERHGNSSDILHRAAGEYLEATRRDSTFALAWAALGDAQALDFFNGFALPALGDSADRASARALALAPNLPEAHGARASYYRFVRSDPNSALEEYHKGLALEPGNVPLLRRAAGAEQQAGRWDVAIADYKQATKLDPQSSAAFAVLGAAQLRLRDYADAQQSLDRALALRPDNLANIEGRTMVSLMRGDLAGARAIIRAAPPSVDRAALLAYIATYYDLGWVLDSAQERQLLSLGAVAFDNDDATRSVVFAEQYRYRGDSTRMRAYADTARVALESQLRKAPDDPQGHLFLGLMWAYLGNKPAAMREAERGIALQTTTGDATGGYYDQQLVRIYVTIGQPEKALDKLEPLLHKPYTLSTGWLRIDPNFAPLRGNPRFERLVASAPPAS